MKLNNKGFSLVELIVVVLIMAIVTGTATVSVVIVYNARVKKAARVLRSQLELCRQKTMAKEDKTGTSGVYMKLYLEDGDYYATIYDGETIVKSEKLGSDQLTIKVGPKNTSISSMDKIEDGHEAIYKFKKSSGGVDSTYTSSSGGNPYLSIYVEGNENYHLMIAEYTGRCYMEADE